VNRRRGRRSEPRGTGLIGVFSRALAASLAAATLAITGSLVAPAAQASGSPDVQLTGTQLASALLPASYFPRGYQRGPDWNSGRRLEHSPAKYSLYTMNCGKWFTDLPVTGYGETATAGAFVTLPTLPTTSGATWIPTYMQDVYQFASPAAADSYFRADHASYQRCWSGSGTLAHVTFTWRTQSLTTGYFGGHRAFYVHLTNKAAGAPGGHTYAQIVLVGTDVFTVSASGTPARPVPAAVLASLIARVQK